MQHEDTAPNTRDAERLRADEWLFHYMHGNLKQAIDIELSGPPIKPADVFGAIRDQLADERLVLLPMKPDVTAAPDAGGR